MKSFSLSLVFLVFFSTFAFSEYIVEEEFIVTGEPSCPATPSVVYPNSTTSTTVVTTTTSPTTVIVPGEQEVYIGMSKYHVADLLGKPTYVEKFRSFTRRHHGIYDEVWTYTSPTGNLVLFIKERRVQKIEHQ